MDYIKLMRSLKDKSYYSKDSEKLHLWIHLLLSANWEEKEESLGGKPILCKAGEFTTGRKQLSRDTGIDEYKIERALTYFEKTEQQIAQRKTSTNRLISILNWEKYQVVAQQNAQQLHNDCTTNAQQLHTLKEYKEEKNKRNKEYKNILLSEIKISDDILFKKIYFETAIGFRDLIRQNLIELNASTKNIDSTKGSAIDEIRLIIESDGFTIEDCRQVYKFLKKDIFWKKNILSIKKLREKFNKLLIEAKNGDSKIQSGNTSYRKNTAGANAEDKRRSVDRLADMAETILQNLAPRNVQ